MSILIKGLDMPKNCVICPFMKTNDDLDVEDYRSMYCDFPQIGEFVTDYEKSRHPDCPLIELPPHGDLIDRDALMKDGWLSLWKRVDYMGGYAIHELPLQNPSIPVVIEKENC